MTDSNVLRKVASLTLDRHGEFKVARPKFVPEKLDFQLYEKFEGNNYKKHIRAVRTKSSIGQVPTHSFDHLFAPYPVHIRLGKIMTI